MDPGRAPLLVFLAHPSNEIAQATINLRAPCPMIAEALRPSLNSSPPGV
jgi:hypothetical protein